MNYENCKKCPKELCKPRFSNIFNDNTYCIVPPCSALFKDITRSKYFLSDDVLADPLHATKFNELIQCITYMIANYNLSLESTLYLTKIKSHITDVP